MGNLKINPRRKKGRERGRKERGGRGERERGKEREREREGRGREGGKEGGTDGRKLDLQLSLGVPAVARSSHPQPHQTDALAVRAHTSPARNAGHTLQPRKCRHRQNRRPFRGTERINTLNHLGALGRGFPEAGPRLSWARNSGAVQWRHRHSPPRSCRGETIVPNRNAASLREPPAAPAPLRPYCDRRAFPTGLTSESSLLPGERPLQEASTPRAQAKGESCRGQWRGRGLVLFCARRVLFPCNGAALGEPPVCAVQCHSRWEEWNFQDCRGGKACLRVSISISP